MCIRDSAGAVLGGKYEFVLTTHVDKDHLHNHLIFNEANRVENQVIMQMVCIDVSCQNKLILAA